MLFTISLIRIKSLNIINIISSNITFLDIIITYASLIFEYIDYLSLKSENC